MAFKLRYRIKNRIDHVLLNKKVMLGIALLAPIMFALSALYLGGFINIFTNNIRVTPKKANIAKKTESKIINVKPLFSWLFKKNDVAGIKVTNTPANVQGLKVPDSAFKHNLNPLYANATELRIANLSIDIPLTSVGVEDSGVLQIPLDWSQGGWYKYGARPGEIGNVIINAHYDDNFGRPAAFWQLKNIKTDDKVLLSDKYGKTYTYSVKESFYVSIKDPNRLDVFADTDDKATMTLITCGGVWLPGSSTYDKRLVVKAEILN